MTGVMSNSCLLRFLCQNLFQGAIFCSLKQWSICISIPACHSDKRAKPMFYGIECQFASSFSRLNKPILPLPSQLGAISLHQKGVFYPSPPAQATRTLKTSQNENGLRLINYRDQHMQRPTNSLENHPSEQFFHLWTGGLSNRFNAKNLHTSIVPCFCISVLQFTLHERSHNETIQKSSCLLTKALQPSFEGRPMAPAKMETLVAESTGCKATPSRFTLNKVCYPYIPF